jgi:hypothetical protein
MNPSFVRLRSGHEDEGNVMDGMDLTWGVEEHMDDVGLRQDTVFVKETTELKTTPLGWAICCAGCFVCPPFNFLGLLLKFPVTKHTTYAIPSVEN